MEIVQKIAEAYCEKYTSPLDELLVEVEQFTEAEHPKAHMLSGKLQGKFLEFLSVLLQPKYVLEVGTFTGFSALCLAKGLQPQGELHTIEIREADAATAKHFFEKSAQASQIKLHVGDAKEIINGLNLDWDIVFIDADKTGYENYVQLLLPKLKIGSVVIVDNVLFHGQVLEENLVGKNPKAIHAFNEYVASLENVEQVMLTVRDGITLIRKK
jgi:caffeoyl-CoA O-methyltransferase